MSNLDPSAPTTSISKPTLTEDTEPNSPPSEDDRILHSGLFNIEASPAFKYLDQLKAKEAIPAQRVEALKNKHHSLYHHILTAFEYEKAMLKKTKTLQADVTKQKLEMDKTGTKVYDDNAIIGELKRELLRLQNEVSLAQARESKYMKELEELLVQKESLMDDIEEIRKHKTHMLEPQILASTKEIKLEIMQKRHQLETLENDLEEKEASYEHAMKDREKFITERENLEKQLANANEMPSKLMQQAEVLRDAIHSLVLENSKQVQLSAQLDKDLEKLAKRRKELEDEKLFLINQLDRHREAMTDRDKKIEEVTMAFHVSKEEHEKYLVQKDDLQSKVKEVQGNIKGLHEQLLVCNKEKEHLMKAYRKLESITNNVSASLPQAKQGHHDLKLHFQLLQRDHSHYQTKLKQLRKEVEYLIYQCLETEQTVQSEKDKYTSQLEHLQRLEHQLDDLTHQASQLQHHMVTLSYDREMRAREWLRMEMKGKKVKDDLHQREMEVQDALKKATDAQQRCYEFAQKYEAMKHERNRYVNLNSSAHQRTMEMKEKVRILRSEIEILRSEITDKENELIKKRQENTTAYSKRDHVKMEANRLLVQYREKRSNIDERTGRIDTLSNSLTLISNELNHLKTKYEQSVAQRNATGLIYLERSDELCMLYEKNNVQQRAMKQGEVELMDLEETIKELKLMKKEMERSIRVKKQWIPKVQMLQKEYIVLMEQYKHTKSNVAALSHILETPTPDRVRALTGTDPSEQELDLKIRQVEDKLATQEEKLIEKTLMLEEVNALTKRLQTTTLEAREGAKTTLVHYNHLTRQLQSIQKEIMATIAELSMSKQLAHALQNQVRDKQVFLTKLTNLTEIPESNHEISLLSSPLDLKNKMTLNFIPKKKKKKTPSSTLKAVSSLSKQQNPTFSYENHVTEEEEGKDEKDEKDEEAEEGEEEEEDNEEEEEEKWSQNEDWKLFLKEKNQQEARLRLHRSTSFASTLNKKHQGSKYLLPSGVKTTAIPRPNAYIPNEEWPIAKPYGQHAPFKPGELNAGVLKYLKKSEVKPIEF